MDDQHLGDFDAEGADVVVFRNASGFKGLIVGSIDIVCGVPTCHVVSHIEPDPERPKVPNESDAVRLFSKGGWQKSLNYQWVCKGHTLIRGKVLTDAPAT